MNCNFKYYSLLFCLVMVIFSCRQEDKGALPYIGDRPELDGDTLIHRIPDFQFVNQLGDTVVNADLKGKIYVADFFFTSCPSICPKVMQQMLRIDAYASGRPDFMLISHTIDPKRDSVATLKKYADNFEVDHSRWWFLTGDQDELLDIADDYFVAALEDASAPGGFDHSGKILLLDKDSRIRSFCDGTDPESVDRFMKDIDRLYDSYQ